MAWLLLLLWPWLDPWCMPLLDLLCTLLPDPWCTLWLILWPTLSATMTWPRSPPTPTSTVWLISSLALPSSKLRLTMEPASGTAPTPSTFPTAGPSTSATTPMTPRATWPRSPTTALPPTLMLPSELAMVLSAMPLPTLLLLLILLPSLAPLPLHLTALP